MQHLRLILIVIPLLFSAACGPLPQPFAHHGPEKTAYPLAELAVDVRVAAVTGLPEPAANALARAVAESLGGYGVTATHRAGAPSRFVLQGEINEPDSSATDIANISITWTLADETGEDTGLHVQELRAAWTDWQRPDPGFIRQAGSAPARAIADLVGIDAELPKPEKTTRLGLFLTGVTGAPGDGNESLAIAIRLALKSRSVSLAAGPQEAAHHLSAEVSVTPPSDGLQTVSITWQVNRPDGKPVGDATQANEIPAGSLDGRWGVIAGYAATAAVDGIADILTLGRERRSSTTITIPSDQTLPNPVDPKTPSTSSKSGA
jgi:hypothetical protein